MSNLNSVNLIGRLTRNPETKVVGAHNICEISIAYDLGYGDKKKTAFVEVKAWNKSGDFVQANFKKGQEILIEGRLDYDSWEDKTDGKKRSKLYVTADRVSFVGKKQDSGNSETVSEASAPVVTEDAPF
jgi:single-strand DNA-binding protein